jgi:hypothetical protein
VKQVNDSKRVIPTIDFPDGSILVEPTNSTKQATSATGAGATAVLMIRDYRKRVA